MFDAVFSATASLWGLFFVSLLAATVLPGGSELALIAFIGHFPHDTQAALLAASVGNTLGGMSTYLIGRLIKQTALPPRIEWVRRFGPPVLLLSWAPVVGDALCLAAGWLRAHWLACLIWMAAGKAARYAFVIYLGTALTP